MSTTIHVITEELSLRAKKIAQDSDDLQRSQTDMLALFQSLGGSLSGRLPNIIIQKIFGMRKDHLEMRNTIRHYKDFLEHAAEQYEWSEHELEKWAAHLSARDDFQRSDSTVRKSDNLSDGRYVPSVIPDITNSPFYQIRPKDVNVRKRMLYNDYANEERVNCVYYARARAMEVNGWGAYPATSTGSDIRSGSIAWFKTPYGDHVVYVEDVDPASGTVCYSDSNMARHPDGQINYISIDGFSSLYGYSLVNYEYPAV